MFECIVIDDNKVNAYQQDAICRSKIVLEGNLKDLVGYENNKTQKHNQIQ